MLDFVPTSEQQNVISEVESGTPYIVINALAGTGKTTLLEMIASRLLSRRILYLAYNYAVKEEAIRRFPSSNTKVHTTHSLAYAYIKKHSPKSLMSVKDYRAGEVAEIFNIPVDTAKKVLYRFENFCNSAWKLHRGAKSKEDELSMRLFAKMTEGEIPATHSFYVKLFQLFLESGKISSVETDILMLDEYQDTNEVTQAIFHAISAPQKIYVGDKHQQIYGFRGAKNAMKKETDAKVFYLTETFRFSSEVAEMPNALLGTIKGESHLIKSKVRVKSVSTEDTYCYISRTNSALIAEMDRLHSRKKRFLTARSPWEIFKTSIDIYNLLSGRKDEVGNKFLLRFKSEDSLEKYIEQGGDAELKTGLKHAREHGSKLATLRSIALRYYDSPAEEKRKIKNFVATAHSSKGLEWDYVEIAHDFPDFGKLIATETDCRDVAQVRETIESLPVSVVDEFNLFYVALTRGKKQVTVRSENAKYLESPKALDTQIYFARQKALEKSTKRG